MTHIYSIDILCPCGHIISAYICTVTLAILDIMDSKQLVPATVLLFILLTSIFYLLYDFLNAPNKNDTILTTVLSRTASVRDLPAPIITSSTKPSVMTFKVKIVIISLSVFAGLLVICGLSIGGYFLYTHYYPGNDNLVVEPDHEQPPSDTEPTDNDQELQRQQQLEREAKNRRKLYFNYIPMGVGLAVGLLVYFLRLVNLPYDPKLASWIIAFLFVVLGIVCACFADKPTATFFAISSSFIMTASLSRGLMLKFFSNRLDPFENADTNRLLGMLVLSAIGFGVGVGYW